MVQKQSPPRESASGRAERRGGRSPGGRAQGADLPERAPGREAESRRVARLAEAPGRLQIPSGPGSRSRTGQEASPIPVLTVPTAPYEDRRPAGGGGLWRPTGLFEGQRNNLPNFIQSVLLSIDLRDRRGCTTVVGSDGRYFSRTAVKIVVQMAAANRVSVRMPLASRRAAAMPSPSPCPPAASGPSWEAPARPWLCFLTPASSPSSAPLPPCSQPPRCTPDTGFY
nr:uncharacterized protein LOC129398063 [Pan paniscus]